MDIEEQLEVFEEAMCLDNEEADMINEAHIDAIESSEQEIVESCDPAWSAF